ncbi:MAG: hypothetical protein K8S94_16335 [Planctomycetia bacterium]|nr:hypothetical protein [Planctomycetia bacterium]
MITASKWQRFLAGTAIRGTVAMVVAVTAVGCKSGSSWTAKPSWWTFGGSPEDASKLASAPPAPTDVTKPSAAAKPYPTTTTPDGYVLANSQAAGQSSTASAVQPQLQSPVEPAAVIYGSRPAAPTTPEALPTAPAQVAASNAPPTGLSSITPQVGPYGSAPAAAPQAPAAAAAFGAAAGTAAVEPAGTRVADARGADSWSTPPAAMPATTESRYGSTMGSRFSGGSMPAAPASTSGAFGSPAALPSEVSLPPSSAAPAGMPASSAPAAAPLAPPTPTRRPDPGYRPGGTSSYRTSRTILAGAPTDETGAVQQASFQTDSGTGP